MNNKRVISLSPSCTEIVCALSCGRQMVGRSHLCDFPELIRCLPACTEPAIDPSAASAEIDRQIGASNQGGHPLLKMDLQKIEALQPELIFHAGAHDNYLLPPNAQVVPCKTTRVLDLWANVQLIADALDVADNGRDVISSLKNRMVDIIAKSCVVERRPTVACLNWIEPVMAAGLWIPELVEFAGGQDVLAKPAKPAVQTDWKSLAKADPEVIVFMLCGFDIARSRRELAILDNIPQWKSLRAVKNHKVYVVDAAQFMSRPGPRLIESLEILAEIITPKDFRFGGEGKLWVRW